MSGTSDKSCRSSVRKPAGSHPAQTGLGLQARTAWVYAAALLAGGALSFLLTSLALFTGNNLACRSTGYSDDYYLAYCDSEKFGDYEHGAIYLGLESAAQTQIRKAEVIFLGDSRTQAAFSTQAVRDFFAGRNIPFYILGFGYNEHSKFALELLRKLEAKPRVLVINASPFFADTISGPGEETIREPPSSLWRYALRKLFQPLHRAICKEAYAACRENKKTIFRSVIDGGWYWSETYDPPEGAIPVDGGFARAISPAEIDQAVELGHKFLDTIGLPRHCVILTGTPSSFTDAANVATHLASALGTSSLVPSMDGMETSDTLHLNKRSAEKWSAKFMELALPLMRECGVS